VDQRSAFGGGQRMARRWRAEGQGTVGQRQRAGREEQVIGRDAMEGGGDEVPTPVGGGRRRQD
jgi:hypothetical protein